MSWQWYWTHLVLTYQSIRRCTPKESEIGYKQCKHGGTSPIYDSLLSALDRLIPTRYCWITNLPDSTRSWAALLFKLSYFYSKFCFYSSQNAHKLSCSRSILHVWMKIHVSTLLVGTFVRFAFLRQIFSWKRKVPRFVFILARAARHWL